MRKTIAVVSWCALGLLPVFGQQIIVNRQNKTIAISADDSVTVDPDVATITLGYQKYAPTKDAAYEENVRVSNEVTKALLNSRSQVRAGNGEREVGTCRTGREVDSRGKFDPYLPDHTKWLKIRNTGYSQWIGRERLFERERASDPDWHHWNTCALVAASSCRTSLAIAIKNNHPCAIAQEYYFFFTGLNAKFTKV